MKKLQIFTILLIIPSIYSIANIYATNPPSSSSSVIPNDITRKEEQELLGETLTETEKWYEIEEISEFKNFSPSIIKLDNGKYRIYWNDGPFDGIVSAISDDGINFTDEEGYRIQSTGEEGDPDCIASHPWVVAMDDGYRMYYQGNENCDFGKNGNQTSSQPSKPIFRIMSAFSKDGLNFEREGVRIDINDTTGLSVAAHGRVIKLDNGTYVMYFSGNIEGNDGPSDLLEATSKDGLKWTISNDVLLQYGHDPSVVKISNKFYIYAGYLAHNTILLESTDGLEFTPLKWVEFYDTDNNLSDGFVDLDILSFDNNKIYIYGSRKESAIGAYQMKTSSSSSSKDTEDIEEPKDTNEMIENEDTLEAIFTDVITKHQNFTAIEYLVKIGTLKGYDDGSFKPSNTINRAEFAKMLVTGQGFSPDKNTYKNCFSDVIDDWYAPYVCFAKEKKWVEGYSDETYKPSATINKVEAIKMTITAFGLGMLVPFEVDEDLFNDTDNNSWYAPFLYVAKDLNLIEETSGSFYPENGMNRASTAENIFRIKAILNQVQKMCSLTEKDCVIKNIQKYSQENGEELIKN